MSTSAAATLVRLLTRRPQGHDDGAGVNGADAQGSHGIVTTTWRHDHVVWDAQRGRDSGKQRADGLSLQRWDSADQGCE